MLENLFAAYFSPTGGSKRAASTLAHTLAKNVHSFDLSLPDTHDHNFNENDIILFAVPVFGGRIPAFVAEKIKHIHGSNTTAIITVVYGNRAYEDALIELSDCVTAQGFVVRAATALLAEHSMSRMVAAGRPDSSDCAQITGYAQIILNKLEKPGTAITVPGNHPYKEWKATPAVPSVCGCVQCGLCVEKCPTQAIPNDNPLWTDPSKCILCMRCISICPEDARSLPSQVQIMIDQKLYPLREIRHENELFV